MSSDIDDFVEAYTRWQQNPKLVKEAQTLKDLWVEGRRQYKEELKSGVSKAREAVGQDSATLTKDWILVVRRWSSDKYRDLQGRSSLTLEGLVGGGYLVSIKGHLIAVDPGYNFLQNLHTQGIDIASVDYVLVSHNHLDHTDGLKDLIRVNRNNKKRRFVIFCNDNVKGTYAQQARGSGIRFETVSGVSKTGRNIGNTGIRFECRPTNHWELGPKGKVKGDTMGFVFFKNGAPILGMVTDAASVQNPAVDYKGARVLVVNLGTLGLSRNHLGITNTANIIKLVHPKLAVISEFDIDEFRHSDVRGRAAEVVRIATSIDTLPADVGLKVELCNPPLIMAKSSGTGEYKMVPFNMVSVVEDPHTMAIAFMTA